MHDYTAIEHTHHNRRAGDVSTWREALVFIVIGALAVILVMAVMH